MKKLLFLLVIVFVLVCMVGCLEKKTVENEDNSENQDSVTFTYTEDLGNDKNGTIIKSMLSKLISDNDKLSDENKVSVKLIAFKGNVSATDLGHRNRSEDRPGSSGLHAASGS